MNCNIYCIYISNAGCFGHVQCGVCSIWAIEYSCRRIWRLRLRVSEYPRAKLPTPFIACHLRCNPLLQPPLCRPEHEYFAQNAVCYITHIIIGKSRQRILSPRTHTHTHTYEELARSLMQTTPPISDQRPSTQRALMWQLQHQQQEPRPRYAHEAGHGQAALPPLHLFFLLLLCQATPLQFSTTPCLRQPLVSRHAVASRGSCRCGWVTATATATLQHF